MRAAVIFGGGLLALIVIGGVIGAFLNDLMHDTDNDWEQK